MAFNFVELDKNVRTFMKEELLHDIPEGHVYLSSRFNDIGRERWVYLLSEAIDEKDEVWLADEILKADAFLDQEPYIKSATGFKMINKEAASKLIAESEFNKYYMRGICLKAIEEGKNYVVVYRAKEVKKPRPESEELINQRINPSTLLEVCRSKMDHETYYLLLEPFSGLSIRTDE